MALRRIFLIGRTAREAQHSKSEMIRDMALQDLSGR
jgi:hypothetical protein